MNRLITLAAVLTALVAPAMAGAGTAAAHATLTATDPAQDSVLTQPPKRVSATFSEAMRSEFAAMTVVGPDQNLWSVGDPQVDGAVIGVGMRPSGPGGTYTANYRATSADGHVVSGSWSFRLAVTGTAATGTPGPPASPPAVTDAADGLPVWPFVAGAVAIVGAGAWWAVRRRP